MILKSPSLRLIALRLDQRLVVFLFLGVLTVFDFSYLPRFDLCLFSQLSLLMISLNPCAARLSKWRSSKLFPDTFNRGFGVVSERGRMRSPRPAAKIKTVVLSGFAVYVVIKIA